MYVLVHVMFLCVYVSMVCQRCMLYDDMYSHDTVFFHLVMFKHVLGPCYARFEHARDIEWNVTYYLACYMRL